MQDGSERREEKPELLKWVAVTYKPNPNKKPWRREGLTEGTPPVCTFTEGSNRIAVLAQATVWASATHSLLTGSRSGRVPGHIAFPSALSSRSGWGWAEATRCSLKVWSSQCSSPHAAVELQETLCLPEAPCLLELLLSSAALHPNASLRIWYTTQSWVEERRLVATLLCILLKTPGDALYSVVLLLDEIWKYL